MDFKFMDPRTAKLAIQFVLADIEDLLAPLYEDILLPDDQQAGLEVMRTDLHNQLEILEGQILTIKILEQEHDNRVAFAKLLEEEKQAVADHQLALTLATEKVNAPGILDDEDTIQYQSTLCDEDEFADDEQWDMAKELYSAAFEGGIPVLPTAPCDPSAAGRRDIKFGTSQPGISAAGTLTCISCFDAVSAKQTLTLNCEPEPHTYCRKCLTELFKSAIKDSSLFPPRCCKIAIPIETCRALLPKSMIKDFDLKLEELATPNPTHCSSCSKFIRLQEIKGDVASCVFCKKETCVTCKGKKHLGLCPEDPHVKLLLDLGNRSRWQQCGQCKNMVELSTGCFHMK